MQTTRHDPERERLSEFLPGLMKLNDGGRCAQEVIGAFCMAPEPIYKY